MFNWSKSIESGPPTESCLDAILDKLNIRLIIMGVVSLIDGYFMIFVFIMQYFLWYGFTNIN